MGRAQPYAADQWKSAHFPLYVFPISEAFQICRKVVNFVQV
jgi:hypothetical protein